MKSQKRKWNLEHQALFLLKLSELLDHGYTLSRAMEFLRFQIPQKLGEDIDHSLNQLKNGVSLHDTFESLGFHRDILGYLYFAERHGDLTLALKEGAKMLQRKLASMKKMKKVVQYPLMLFSFLFIIFFVLATVLLPQFKTLYSSMGTEMSLPLALLINFVGTFPYGCAFLSLFLAISFVVYRAYMQKMPPYKRMGYLLKIPGVKNMVPLFNSYFFSIHISNLLNGGLSVHDCLTLFERQRHYPFFQAEAAFFKEQLVSGAALEQIMFKREYYDAQLANVIAHGQSNGDLAKELGNHSQFILERLEQMVFKWLNIIQPLLFSLIGLLVLTMYLSIMLPMLKMMSTV
jgi:competence protein ComGB